jgi:hypothetical protein
LASDLQMWLQGEQPERWEAKTSPRRKLDKQKPLQTFCLKESVSPSSSVFPFIGLGPRKNRGESFHKPIRLDALAVHPEPVEACPERSRRGCGFVCVQTAKTRF